MKRLKGAIACLSLAFSVAWVTAAGAAGGGEAVSSDEALQRLMEGNKRFLASQMTACQRTTRETVQKLSTGQQPYAVILSCSDSRVPPELIFDVTLGDIFAVRVAGNVPDQIVLGSVEYAVEHLGSPLVMVLGHERCGAVTAAFEARGKPEGNIGTVIKTITPAVTKAKQTAKGKSIPDQIEAAIDFNISLTAGNLTRHSRIIKRLVQERKVKIVEAKYDLDDGKVNLFTGK